MTSLRLLDSLAEIPASQWDALHDGSNPFVSHAFLHGMETHGCLRPAWGWKPRHAALVRGGTVVAAAPAYLKGNSHGEFVFDHAWAQAYAHHGLDYFPKWLVAVPYSPVTGPRLLAPIADDGAALLAAMLEQMGRDGLSSMHANFLPASALSPFDDRWIARADVQFHWNNPDDWIGFEDFLGAMTSRKRKTIRAERTQVRRAGVDFRIVHGDEAGETDLAAMHAFYCATQTEKGNTPVLSLAFFRHLARELGRGLVLILAMRGNEAIAGALCLRGGDTLYGRYWGSFEPLPGLHFETCYYQGIEYCLREGLARFEPGAQGEHKLARGFLPTLTHSRHFIANPAFAQALRPWCEEERLSVERYRDLVLEHTPFRAPTSNPSARA